MYEGDILSVYLFRLPLLILPTLVLFHISITFTNISFQQWRFLVDYQISLACHHFFFILCKIWSEWCGRYVQFRVYLMMLVVFAVMLLLKAIGNKFTSSICSTYLASFVAYQAVPLSFQDRNRQIGCGYTIRLASLLLICLLVCLLCEI